MCLSCDLAAFVYAIRNAVFAAKGPKIDQRPASSAVEGMHRLVYACGVARPHNLPFAVDRIGIANNSIYRIEEPEVLHRPVALINIRMIAALRHLSTAADNTILADVGCITGGPS